MSMSDPSALLSWLLAMLEFGLSFALLAFALVLVRISKLPDFKYLVLASLSFLLFSFLQLLLSGRFVDASLALIDFAYATRLSTLFLFLTAFFLFFLFLSINKNLKKYR